MARSGSGRIGSGKPRKTRDCDCEPRSALASSTRRVPRRPRRGVRCRKDPELARLVAEAREIDRRNNEELGRRVRQLSDEELGQFVSYLMRTRQLDDDEEEDAEAE